MSDNDYSELRKFVAPEFVFGAGAAMLVGQYAANLSIKKALVVTDPVLESIGCLGRIVDRLREEGVNCTVFSDITPNPRHAEVMAGAEVYRREGCDAIVAVGGGSPMDCAKAIGIVCTNNRHVLEFEGVDNVERPGPPLICIPTTAGTAADISQFCIINNTDRHVKIAIVSKTMVPDLALIDPLLTLTMGEDLTAHTGLDALTHAFEAFVSNASSPITDLNAMEAVRLVNEHLLAAVQRPDDMEARTGMMLASTHAGLAFSNAILGAVHAMAHSLGGLLDVPHGLCNAILLDHVVEYNFASEPEKYRKLGLALGAPIPQDAPLDAAREETLNAIRSLKQSVGIKDNLYQLGMTEAVLPLLAENSLADACMLTNPKQPTTNELIELFRQAC
ncbi:MULTISPECIES: alcohol dehydrogenase-like regulatory protein ErcA [unclassified Pseudodesulfovibrio]|uniref:alcohol dehydrogenase-like regulatory protein ErcA n=1 Tax=unclassified Pseudodesulfovibrio TaxID=2661612 RepID=UPI000FEB8C7E|nr:MULTISPECIES: alcohol dehydrogenase-like regulatory protein ErcA [unclassified Pseudodesulfovibrio]MCJ2165979.1 iron-containing alcohol dehydrogenase [Pseudodesulfovibrio sp. S3-i]RWU02583.1 iron-containing alcohol dehydrogenase [Pseudodesulfovibrio sp. S3]